MKQELKQIDLGGVNCYLVETEQGFILFDTGGHMMLDKQYTDRRNELIEKLSEAGCKPGNLKAIILTHGDSDHVANAAFLRDKYQSIIAMHGQDVDLVSNLTVDKMMESFRFQSIIYKIVLRIMNNKIRNLFAKMINDFQQFKPDVILKEGDDLLKYGLAAKIIHLPGHTPGSIGILLDSGELIAGDSFTNMKNPALAMNAMDFKQLGKSIMKLKPMNIKDIYPGHGKPFQAKKLGIGNM